MTSTTRTLSTTTRAPGPCECRDLAGLHARRRAQLETRDDRPGCTVHLRIDGEVLELRFPRVATAPRALRRNTAPRAAADLQQFQWRQLARLRGVEQWYLTVRARGARSCSSTGSGGSMRGGARVADSSARSPLLLARLAPPRPSAASRAAAQRERRRPIPSPGQRPQAVHDVSRKRQKASDRPAIQRRSSPAWRRENPAPQPGPRPPRSHHAAAVCRNAPGCQCRSEPTARHQHQHESPTRTRELAPEATACAFMRAAGPSRPRPAPAEQERRRTKQKKQHIGGATHR